MTAGRNDAGSAARDLADRCGILAWQWQWQWHWHPSTTLHYPTSTPLIHPCIHRFPLHSYINISRGRRTPPRPITTSALLCSCARREARARQTREAKLSNRPLPLRFHLTAAAAACAACATAATLPWQRARFFLLLLSSCFPCCCL